MIKLVKKKLLKVSWTKLQVSSGSNVWIVFRPKILDVQFKITLFTAWKQAFIITWKTQWWVVSTQNGGWIRRKIAVRFDAKWRMKFTFLSAFCNNLLYLPVLLIDRRAEAQEYTCDLRTACALITLLLIVTHFLIYAISILWPKIVNWKNPGSL